MPFLAAGEAGEQVRGIRGFPAFLHAAGGGGLTSMLGGRRERRSAEKQNHQGKKLAS